MIYNCKWCKTDVICNNNKNVCTECEAIIVKCQFCDDYIFCDTDETNCDLCGRVFCYSCSINEKLIISNMANDFCVNKIECLKRKEKLSKCAFCNDDIFLNCDAHCVICNLLFCKECRWSRKIFVVWTSLGDYVCANKIECLKRVSTTKL